MANEKLKAARALPRGLAREFCTHRYFSWMVFALIAQCVMGILSAVQDALSGGDMMLIVFSMCMVFILGYVTVSLAGLRTRQDQKSAKRAARAVIIYFVVMLSYIFILGGTYFSMNSIIRSGGMPELPPEAVEQWTAFFPFTILLLAVQLIQSVVYGFLFRALNDVKELTTGKYPQRNAFTAVSFSAALAAGMALCNLGLGLYLSWGDAVSMLTTIVGAIPSLVFNFSLAQLSRYMIMRRNGQA